VKDVNYQHFIASRGVLSDASIKVGEGFWFTTPAGVAALSGGVVQRRYGFASTDRPMHIQQVIAELPSPAPVIVAMACSPTGDRCYLARKDSDSSGNLRGTSVDVVNTSTHLVERTISRTSADEFVGINTIIADDDAVYVSYYPISGDLDRTALTKLDPKSGAQLASAVFSSAYYIQGFGISPSSRRIWVHTHSQSYPGVAEIRIFDTQSMQLAGSRAGDFFALGAVGGAVAVVGGAPRIITIESSPPHFALLEGDALATIGQLTLPGTNLSSNVQSICVERSGQRGWVLFNRDPTVYEILINGNSMSWGRRIAFEEGFEFGVTSPVTDVIRCLQ
jgi:hypothetical protein